MFTNNSLRGGGGGGGASHEKCICDVGVSKPEAIICSTLDSELEEDAQHAIAFAFGSAFILKDLILFL